MKEIQGESERTADKGDRDRRQGRKRQSVERKRGTEEKDKEM